MGRFLKTFDAELFHPAMSYIRYYCHDEQIEHIKRETNIVRPPVDYMGITEVRPDLLSFFVKPEGETT